MAGSGLFSKRKAVAPHLVVSTGPGGGIAGEVADLRQDVANELGKLASLTVDEFVNAPAASATAFKTSHNTSAGTKVFTVGAGLDGASAGVNLLYPRPPTVTVGGTSADAANVPITFEGVDMYGKPMTEVVLANGAGGTTVGSKCFKKYTKITEGPGVAGVTGATLTFGFGAPLGLSLPIRTVQGLTGALREIAGGAAVTNGVFVAAATASPNGSYSPNSAPDGARDYAVYYDFDPTVVTPTDVKVELDPPERLRLPRRHGEGGRQLRRRRPCPAVDGARLGRGPLEGPFLFGSRWWSRVGEQEHRFVEQPELSFRGGRPGRDELFKELHGLLGVLPRPLSGVEVEGLGPPHERFVKPPALSRHLGRRAEIVEAWEEVRELRDLRRRGGDRRRNGGR